MVLQEPLRILHTQPDLVQNVGFAEAGLCEWHGHLAHPYFTGETPVPLPIASTVVVRDIQFQLDSLAFAGLPST